MAKQHQPKADERNGHIRAGIIRMQIQDGPLDGKTLEMDATIVKMCAAPLQKKHLTEVDGFYEATPEFAVALSARLIETGYESTPAIAIAAWELAAAYFEEVQKKTPLSRNSRTGTASTSVRSKRKGKTGSSRT